jgi:hypothetical protein
MLGPTQLCSVHRSSIHARHVVPAHGRLPVLLHVQDAPQGRFHLWVLQAVWPAMEVSIQPQVHHLAVLAIQDYGPVLDQLHAQDALQGRFLLFLVPLVFHPVLYAPVEPILQLGHPLAQSAMQAHGLPAKLRHRRQHVLLAMLARTLVQVHQFVPIVMQAHGLLQVAPHLQVVA